MTEARQARPGRARPGRTWRDMSQQDLTRQRPELTRARQAWAWTGRQDQISSDETGHGRRGTAESCQGKGKEDLEGRDMNRLGTTGKAGVTGRDASRQAWAGQGRQRQARHVAHWAWTGLPRPDEAKAGEASSGLNVAGRGVAGRRHGRRDKTRHRSAGHGVKRLGMAGAVKLGLSGLDVTLAGRWPDLTDQRQGRHDVD